MLLKCGDLLSSGKPAYHLRKFISSVGSSPTFLGEVDMKMLEHFGVVVVGGSKETNGLNIMEHRVELGNIEVVTNTGCFEELLVFMKASKGILQISNGDAVMGGVL